MTLNLIETLKPSIYNPKDTNNTKIHLIFFNIFKNQYFPKIQVKKKSAFYDDFIALFIYVEGHTA